MAQSAPMHPAQALQIAILVLDFEAETAQATGNGVWRFECIEAMKALRRMSKTVNFPVVGDV